MTQRSYKISKENPSANVVSGFSGFPGTHFINELTSYTSINKASKQIFWLNKNIQFVQIIPLILISEIICANCMFLFSQIICFEALTIIVIFNYRYRDFRGLHLGLYLI